MKFVFFICQIREYRTRKTRDKVFTFPSWSKIFPNEFLCCCESGLKTMFWWDGGQIRFFCSLVRALISITSSLPPERVQWWATANLKTCLVMLQPNVGIENNDNTNVIHFNSENVVVLQANCNFRNYLYYLKSYRTHRKPKQSQIQNKSKIFGWKFLKPSNKEGL